MELDPPRLVPPVLQHHGHAVLLGRGPRRVGKRRAQAHRLALTVLAAIGRQLDLAAAVGQLRPAEVADHLDPVPGEEDVAGAPPPSPGFVGGVKQHLARPHVLHRDDRQLAPFVAGARGVFGQDARARLQVGGLDHPVKRRELLPDLAAFGRRVAKLHGRGGQPQLGRLHDEPVGQRPPRLRIAGAARVDRHQWGQGRAAVGGGHEAARAGHEHQGAPLAGLADEVHQVLHRGVAQQGRVEVAQDDHVVAEQLVALDGKDAQGGVVLLGVLGVGVGQHRVERDRLVAAEHVAEVAELEVGIARRQQHADLPLAHVYRLPEAVVLGVQLAFQRLDLDDVAEVALPGGAIGYSHLLRLSVGSDHGVDSGQHLGLALLVERDGHRAARKAVPGQLGLEVDDVVDEDDLLDQQVAELEVAHGPLVAQPHGQKRHALAPRVGGRLRKRRPFGRDAVGQQHDGRRRRPPQVAQDRAHGASQPGALPVGPARLDLFQQRVVVGGGAGAGPGRRVLQEIDPQLVVPRHGGQKFPAAPQQEHLGQAQPAELAVLQPGLFQAAAELPGQLLVVAVRRAHASRIVDQHDQVGQPGAVQRQGELGKHRQDDGHQRKPDGRQHHAEAHARGAALAQVDPHHPGHGEDRKQQRDPGGPGPGVLQAPDRAFPGAGLDAEQALDPSWQVAAHGP